MPQKRDRPAGRGATREAEIGELGWDVLLELDRRSGDCDVATKPLKPIGR
jgi:hypothetical protein